MFLLLIMWSENLELKQGQLLHNFFGIRITSANLMTAMYRINEHIMLCTITRSFMDLMKLIQ